MAKDIFEEHHAEAESAPVTLGNRSNLSMMEKAGYAIAAAILLVVIVVMTADIKVITIQRAADLSVSFFVLVFCSYGMYVNMYRSGMLAGEKTSSYKKVCEEYDQIRADLKKCNLQKRLTEFCIEYVEIEHRARIEEILLPADISWEEYDTCRHLSKAEIMEKGYTRAQFCRIRAANRVRPIKLTPEMLYKQGRMPVKRGALHTQPAVKRRGDFIKKLVTTAMTSGATGFIAFELFSELTWRTVCSVSFKLLMVALTGYSGYTRGYDNIATDSVLYTQDQIDLLRQFEAWKNNEKNKNNSPDEARA